MERGEGERFTVISMSSFPALAMSLSTGPCQSPSGPAWVSAALVSVSNERITASDISTALKEGKKKRREKEEERERERGRREKEEESSKKAKEERGKRLSLYPPSHVASFSPYSLFLPLSPLSRNSHSICSFAGDE